ncbi:hypothetical protein Golomagni_01039 [Golovinomyces magnicellulatus]|nr:hypothetical protein Golomagni_01039 [Golovinomyces magnicellulatus]
METIHQDKSLGKDIYMEIRALLTRIQGIKKKHIEKSVILDEPPKPYASTETVSSFKDVSTNRSDLRKHDEYDSSAQLFTCKWRMIWREYS